MKLLEKEFKGRGSQKGWMFKLIKREKNVAIYEKKSGECVYHEVMIVKSHNGLTIGNVYREPAEFLPSDNQFGTQGWCYQVNQIEKIENKFQQLLKQSV